MSTIAAGQRPGNATIRTVLSIAAPVTLLAGALLVPTEADTDVTTVAEANAQLDIIADHQPATYVGFLCIALALALVGCFGWQLGRLPAGRGRTVARIGGVMVFVGGVAAGLANLILGVLQTSAAQQGIDRDAAAAQLLATESGSILAPFFLPYIVGLILGGVVLTIGLLVSRVLPWWIAVLVGVSIIALFFSSSGPLGVATTTIMLVAFVAAARWRTARRPTHQPAVV